MSSRITDPKTPRQSIARLGGLATSSRHDPQIYTAKARATFNERWLRDIPTDLPEAERLRRAEAAKKLYFATIGRRGGKARKSR